MIKDLLLSTYGLLEVLKYILALHLIFRLKFKVEKRWIAALLVLCYPYLVLCNSVLDEKYCIFAILIASTIICRIIIDDKWIKTFLLLMLSTFALSIVDIMGYYLFDGLGMLNGVDHNFMNIVGFVFVIILGTLLDRTDGYGIDVKQYMIWGIGVFGCFLTIVMVTSLQTDNLSKDEIHIWGIVSWVIFISYVFLMNYYIFIMCKNKSMEDENQQYKNMIKIQKKEIEERILSDERVRRVRHDMRAHLVAIEKLASEGMNKELKEYVARLKSESSIFKMESFTGNVAVDAVVRDCIEKANKKGIEIVWHGKLTELSIDTYDLCVIISNLLNNAEEACVRLEENERKVSAELYNMGKRFLFRVNNPVEWDLVIENGKLMTTKADKKNHGIGIQNVNQIVESYNGSVEYLCENGVFSVEVFI